MVYTLVLLVVLKAGQGQLHHTEMFVCGKCARAHCKGAGCGDVLLRFSCR